MNIASLVQTNNDLDYLETQITKLRSLDYDPIIVVGESSFIAPTIRNRFVDAGIIGAITSALVWANSTPISVFIDHELSQIDVKTRISRVELHDQPLIYDQNFWTSVWPANPDIKLLRVLGNKLIWTPTIFWEQVEFRKISD